MASSKGEGTGEAADAEVTTEPAPEQESAEEHQAAIQARLQEAADAVLASAESKVTKAKESLAAAEASLKKAEDYRASLEE